MRDLSFTILDGYYDNLLQPGDTKEADNPIDNIMCQDILNNVILGCESELWTLRFGIGNGIDFCPWPCQRARNVGIKHNVTFNNCNCFANNIHIEMFIKSITLFYSSVSYKK